jgi:glutaredoxin
MLSFKSQLKVAKPIWFTITHTRYFHSPSSLRQAISLTFFTKDTCKLCTDAKEILNKTLNDEVNNNKEIKLKTIDIMDPQNQKWFDVYCYDVPVLHVDREGQLKPVKFMHYFHQDKLTNEFQKQ